MKPILINIGEMSDSREVYESKPNIFFAIFIYTVLGMLLVALTWMYFGRIDIVVKSEGMLRPNNQVATVINNYAGTLEKVNVTDGTAVKEGAVLYIIEHGDILTEQSFYKEQLSDAEKSLKLLEKYKKCIEDKTNYFQHIPEEEEYFIKYQNFQVNYDLLKHDYMYNSKERSLNLKAADEQLAALKRQLANTELLKKTVNKNANLFSAKDSDQEYYNLFVKYQNDLASITTKYDNARLEIDNSTTEEGMVNSLEYYQNTLNGLEQLQSSINNGKSTFEASDYYSLQYDEYVNKLESLTASHKQAKENYEINLELAGLAVTEWEVGQSKSSMEEAERAIDAYKSEYLANLTTKITEVNKNLQDLALSREHTISKDKLYEKNEKEREAELENYRLQYTVELDKTINTIKDNIKSLETNISSLELQGEKTLLLGDRKDTEANLLKYKNDEISTVLANIKTYSDKIDELKSNLDKLNSQMKEAIVKATKSGVVNSSVELVEGDTLSGGVQVLTIIPEEDSEYKANIYVNNKDIGKLKAGMKTKFNIYALPNTEYGYLTGTITSISKDLKVDSNSGSGYYLVEAKIDNKRLYDEQGREARLKAGMTCQAQMITENKRILVYVLNKIDMWIH